MEQLRSWTCLDELICYFSDDESCVSFLYKVRWPDGFTCPLCFHSRAYTIHSRRLPLYECCACHHQTSLTSGTVLEHSRTSLQKWIIALWFVSQRQASISAIQLQSIIQVTYKTAWSILHKIRAAISIFDSYQPLEGTIQASVAYHGKPSFSSSLHLQQREYPLIIGASIQTAMYDEDTESHCDGTYHSAELSQYPDGLGLPDHNLSALSNIDSEAVHYPHPEALQHNNSTTQIVSLKMKLVHRKLLRGRSLSANACTHFINQHTDTCSSGISIIQQPYRSQPAKQLLTLYKQARRCLISTFHGIGPKYLQHYLDEFCFRANATSEHYSAWQCLVRLIMSPHNAYDCKPSVYQAA